MEYIIYLIVIILVFAIFIYINKETFLLKPTSCSPFLYPNMYQPQASCSDPFNWGFTYSTGPNPHVYSPVPRRLPPKKECMESAFMSMHSNSEKYNKDMNYNYNYDYA